MKKIITLCILVLICGISFAQTWTEINNAYPGVCCGGRGCGAFSIGGTCYFVGGGPYYYDTWAFDTLGDTWTQEQNYPKVVDGTYVGFSLNGLGYIATGVGYGYGWDSSLWQFNPAATTQWTELAHFPGQPRGYAVGFTLDGRLFLGCGIGNSVGYTGLPLNDFYEYNPATNTWDSIAHYPGAATQYNTSFVVGDKAYVGGGVTVSANGSTSLAVNDDFWEYDTISKVWTKIANFSGGNIAAGTGLSSCDKGFVGLGYSNTNQSGVYDNFWEYDPGLDRWTEFDTYGGVARFVANGFVIGKSFFVGLGVNSSSGTQADIWELIRSFTPAFSADTFVCQGGSVTFTDTSNYLPDHWYWQFPGGTPDTSTQQSVTINYDTSGYHDVTLTAWNGCGDSATKTFASYVHVGYGGILSIMPPHATICYGQSVSLVLTDTGTFTWSPSAGLNTTTGDSVIATPSATTAYTVTGASSGGCSLTGTDTVKVDSAPALIILPQPPPTFCSGQNATLKVSSGGSDFTWSPSTGLSATTGDSVVANPTASTTYTVMGNDSLGCVTSGTESVSVILSPNKPTFHQHGDTLISSSKYDNQWYYNGNMLNGDTSQDLIITTIGNYWVNVANEANGCSTTSDTTTIDTVNGINQLSLIANQLSIYPNPFNNDVVIKINSSAQNVKSWSLQIIDVLGRTVYSQQSLNYTTDIDLSNLSGGVYFITVINKSGRAVIPVVHQ